MGLFPQGLKARTIQVFILFLIVRAFSPYEKKGHLSWGDAALAPGWYKSAPLALNYGF
jgi:hypothetical protein